MPTMGKINKKALFTLHEINACAKQKNDPLLLLYIRYIQKPSSGIYFTKGILSISKGIDKTLSAMLYSYSQKATDIAAKDTRQKESFFA